MRARARELARSLLSYCWGNVYYLILKSGFCSWWGCGFNSTSWGPVFFYDSYWQRQTRQSQWTCWTKIPMCQLGHTHTIHSTGKTISINTTTHLMIKAHYYYKYHYFQHIFWLLYCILYCQLYCFWSMQHALCVL